MRELPLLFREHALACFALCLAAPGCSPPPPSPAPAPAALTMQKLAAVPCTDDPPIVFHAAKPGQQDDRANAYDTPETVAAIEKHNAARKAVCP